MKTEISAIQSLVEFHCDVVDLIVDLKESKWLVAQKFEGDNSKLINLMTKCASIPVSGVAIPLCGKSPSLRMRPFCFLPIGDISTGLPIHINGTFQVHKNRRSIWLDSVST